ncbi:hypothetical protein [Dyadobacter psychrotolerans]|uniref:SLA1 homology domain-containing protein n=1 Tax=Dyadobacter psychrotolerans TaxID=2541721 RepID=A0A4R5DRP2_9BACT|nr:hypothetical protein [Dyadobacter psychrotolerans]TDE17092.1 hypothetical protein E0F88_04105 [Dyadobacter psychrotolerans]
MKKRYTIILFLLTTLTTQAQETLYWANGSSFPFKLVEATESIVKVGEMKGDRIVKRSVPKENVLVAFNAKGNYLLVSDLSADPAQASLQIQNFYASHGPQNDLLLQANPLKVIECTISYKSENVVNYITPQGVTGSINRNELALIIFKSGDHEFVLSPADAAPVLKDASAQVQKAISQPAKKTAATEIRAAVIKTPATAVLEPSHTVEKPAEVVASAIPQKNGLSKEELGTYSQKGIKKVDEFVQYLNIISDKSIDPDKKDEAIEQALKLFLADATIEVSSANRQGKRKYPVKDYLTRLKLLPYGSTNISWNEVNYVNDLTQASDGNYYGTITGSQTFTGYGANSQDVMYSDVTRKSVKVKLQSYKKSVEGQQTTNWDILLGNVGISVNQ